MPKDIYLCTFCKQVAAYSGTVRNTRTHLDDEVLVCKDHRSKCHAGTVKLLFGATPWRW